MEEKCLYVESNSGCVAKKVPGDFVWARLSEMKSANNKNTSPISASCHEMFTHIQTNKSNIGADKNEL
jgi:hypothetical protein